MSGAHEILIDPTLRAKFDAERLRDRFAKPQPEASTRPNVPPRAAGTSDFPPPPRPPPYTPNRSTFSPPPSAARKYDKYSRTSTGWSNVDPADARAKNNDFKAWEQMRHGQPTMPSRRAPPPQWSPGRSAFDMKNTSPPGRASYGPAPKPPRRPWEDLKDAGMPPNLSRANTARPSPKKGGFAPASAEQDEGQVPSARYNVFSNDRSKHASAMPPPPPRAPTSKRPDPMPAFTREPFVPTQARVSTPYQTTGGEKTYFGSGPGLHRSATSATPRETTSRTEHYKDSSHLNGDHVRASSAQASHRQEAFRPMEGSSSATTTDTSSSDEADEKFVYSRPREPRNQTSARSGKCRVPAGAGPRSAGFSPHVRVEQAEDEGQAPRPLYDGSRRHSGIDFLSQRSFDEGQEALKDGRSKPGPDRPGPQAASAPTGSGSGDRFAPRHHRSFDAHYKSPSIDGPSPNINDETSKSPMYGNPGYFPLSLLHYSGPLPSEKWSQQWPFGPLKEQTSRDSLRIPYQAVPSSLPPAATIAQNLSPLDEPVLARTKNQAPNYANPVFGSFRWSHGQSDQPTPPLRRQSSESINTQFSPSRDVPKFGGDKPFFPRSRAKQDKPDDPPIAPNEVKGDDQHDDGDSPGSHTKIPPPPKVGDKWSAEDWEKRFGFHTFELPANGQSSRNTSRKRGPSRSGSASNLKRAGTSRSANLQPSVTEAGDEPTMPRADSMEPGANSTGSSRTGTGSDDSAMDIDSSPPAGSDNTSRQTDARGPSATGNEGGATPRATPVSLNATNGTRQEPDSLNLNLNSFRHVAPFQRGTGEGLGAVDDLKDALPFESRPSPTRPNFEYASKPLDFPRVPKAPVPPQQLSPANWDAYVADMNNYMFNWNTFSYKMLIVFQRRQEEHREIGPSWIAKMGGDCTAYLEGLDEDERARKFWDIASDHHKDCMMKLKDTREKMLRQSKGR